MVNYGEKGVDYDKNLLITGEDRAEVSEDNPLPVTVKDIDVSIETAIFNSDIDNIGGNPVNVGAGAAGTGTPRVISASDDPVVSGIGAVGDAAATQGSTGSVSAKLRTATSQLNSIQTALEIMDDWDSSDRCKVVEADGDFGSIGKSDQAIVDAGAAGTVTQKLRRISSDIGGIFAAIATIGSAVKTYALQVCGTDGTNARTIAVDANGQVKVVLADTTLEVTDPVPISRKLIGTKVGSDASMSWANSELINTYRHADFTAPATVDQEYEVIVVNPSQDANLVMNIFNKETAIGSTPITRPTLLYGPITIPKLVPAAVNYCIKYTAGTTTYADETTDINSSGAGDVPAPPAGTVEDALYFGENIPFHGLHITIGTAGVYDATVVWEYYDVDTTWKAIPGITDGTVLFTAAAGTYKVLWNPPDTWAPVAVSNGATNITKYWIRARCSEFTSVATPPLLTQAWSQSAKTPSSFATLIHGLFNGGTTARILLHNETAVSATGAFTASVRIREVM